MKIRCSKCQELRYPSEFNVRGRRRIGSECLECEKAFSRLRSSRSYYRDKQTYIRKAKERREKIKQYIREIKEKTGCADCRQKLPYYCLDFDHIRDKTDNISTLLRNASMAKVVAEIQKCEIVCANCHRQRTFERKK